MTYSEYQPRDVVSTKALISELDRHCRDYKKSDVRRGLWQLFTTLGAFFALSAFMIAAVLQGIYWPLIGVLPAGGLLVRLFIIQHDCGHQSFFPSRRANDMTGRLLSFFTWTPYAFWAKAHNLHHAGSGNLDRRGIGSIDTLTVEEYKAMPVKSRLLYRLYRNPVLLLVLGTPVYVMLVQRIPHEQGSPFIEAYKSLSAAKSWKSIAGLDLALLVGYGALFALFGWKAVCLAMLPPVVIAAWAGGWLFFIQHQFEHAYWKDDETWNFHEAAVLGSSYYHLPRWLQWFTGNIGLHHIHHLCSAVPNYRLQECLEGHEALQELNKMNLKESLACASWALWDEKQKKMVSFADLRRY